jgi:hypothetical protein
MMLGKSHLNLLVLGYSSTEKAALPKFGWLLYPARQLLA